MRRPHTATYLSCKYPNFCTDNFIFVAQNPSRVPSHHTNIEMSSLPYAADAEAPLSAKELQVLRAQYEKEGEYVSLQTKFNFAWGLIKSSSRGDQQQGVLLLSGIFRDSPDRRRECLYYLALGNFKLGNYAEARRYNDSLLELEPGNLQARSLKDLIEDKVAKEGLMGVAIVGGLAAAAAVGVGFLIKGAQRGGRR
nr:mitochondria fission 1 protein [Quercus suber]